MGNFIMRVTEVGSEIKKELVNCINLNIVKEVYSPFSIMSGKFHLNVPLKEIRDVEILYKGTIIYKGIIDTCRIVDNITEKSVFIKSRSYTSLLIQNEINPGIHNNVSLNSLMRSTLVIPNITNESSSATINYIYVNEHAKIWEAIVNLCLKQKGNYPYVLLNKIMFSKSETAKDNSLSLSNNNIISVTQDYDYTRIISSIHMADANNAYLNNGTIAFATDRNINRIKYVPLDREWLNDIPTGIANKLKYSTRGGNLKSVKYFGFNNEELNQFLTFSGGGIDLVRKRISKVEVNVGPKGVITTLSCYKDEFNN